jgi:hypothetical protein
MGATSFYEPSGPYGPETKKRTAYEAARRRLDRSNPVGMASG